MYPDFDILCVMEKSKWPQAWKDQYNEVIRQRKLSDRLQQEKQAKLDAREFPQLWHLHLSEDNVFPLIAYDFPLHRVLTNLLQRFIKPGAEHELRLSSRYLINTRKVCPAYYSDRERAVVILNRFQNNQEWEELFHWVSFFSERGYYPHMHFMLGVIFLDKYLHQTHQDIWLKQSIHHLRKVENWVEREDSRKALSSVQALAFYLNRDFDRALGYLGVRKQKTFEEDFAELMDRLAA
jgi:hypothetical protein